MNELLALKRSKAEAYLNEAKADLNELLEFKQESKSEADASKLS